MDRYCQDFIRLRCGMFRLAFAQSIMSFSLMEATMWAMYGFAIRYSICEIAWNKSR
jgi:hypothetical protein